MALNNAASEAVLFLTTEGFRLDEPVFRVAGAHVAECRWQYGNPVSPWEGKNSKAVILIINSPFRGLGGLVAMSLSLNPQRGLTKSLHRCL